MKGPVLHIGAGLYTILKTDHLSRVANTSLPYHIGLFQKMEILILNVSQQSNFYRYKKIAIKPSMIFLV